MTFRLPHSSTWRRRCQDMVPKLCQDYLADLQGRLGCLHGERAHTVNGIPCVDGKIGQHLLKLRAKARRRGVRSADLGQVMSF